MSRNPAADALPAATISESNGVRYLHLGTQWVQGALNIRKPFAIELEYVQRMLACLLLRKGADLCKGHAVQLGLGAGSLTRFFYSKLHMQTTAVEINASVIDACRTWFELQPDGPRLTVLRQDAATFAADTARAGSVQVLCIDLYDREAAAPVLDSEAFYAGCRRLLSDDGVMSVNLFGRRLNFHDSARRIAAVFGESLVRVMQPTDVGNSIVVAANSGPFPPRSLLAARAKNIETRLHLPAGKWLQMIGPLRPGPQETTAGCLE